MTIIEIQPHGKGKIAFYLLFGIVSLFLFMYYLSYTLIAFTTPQQFPINSFERFPLTYLIFPAEIFSLLFALYFVYCLVHGNTQPLQPKPLENKKDTPVAILVPVYNEPKQIVKRTLEACNNVRWEGKVTVYLLDDSTSPAHIQSMAKLSQEYGCTLIRRSNRVGYKAGNINNAIQKHVKEPFFVIFDSDQAPDPEFLEQMMDHFSDPQVAYVQTPQYYVKGTSDIERAAKLGCNIFFHAQCVAKAKDGAMPFCGTNVIVRTSAFVAVKGFSYYTSTEDIDLGLRLTDFGYVGRYVPKVLAQGFAPPDFSAYASQQYRWANGNLAIFREHWKRIIFGEYSLRYKIHYFFTLAWWLVGVVTLLYIIVPILSLFIGGTHHAWLPTSMLVLLFFQLVMGIMMIYMSLSQTAPEDRVRFRDALLQYSLITNSSFIYAKAALNALFKKYAGFIRTNKTKGRSSALPLLPNLVMSAICYLISIYALFMSARSTEIIHLRTYLPISLWLFIYASILASSIFFIDGEPVKLETIVNRPIMSYILAEKEPKKDGI